MNRKRILAWLLTLAMVVTMLPATVFADEQADTAAPESIEIVDDSYAEPAVETESADNVEAEGANDGPALMDPVVPETVTVTFTAKDKNTGDDIASPVFTVTDADSNPVEAVSGAYTLTVGSEYTVAVTADQYRDTSVKYTAKADETSYAVEMYHLKYYYWMQIRLCTQYAEQSTSAHGTGEVVTLQKEGSDAVVIAPPEGTYYVLDDLEPGATYTVKVVKEGCDLVSEKEWDVDRHGYHYLTDGKTEYTNTFVVTPVSDGGKEHMGNLIVEFIAHEEAPAVNFEDVDAALAKVPANLELFTDDSAAALNNAVNAVDRTSESQEAVDAMAAAINDALAGLIPKDGTYEVTMTKYNNTPYYLYEGLGDSEKTVGKALLKVENGVMSADVTIKGTSYGMVCLGTKDDVTAAAEAAGDYPAGTIFLTKAEEKKTFNGKEYDSYSGTIPVPALATRVEYAYHSSNTTRYDYKTGWYAHGLMFQPNSLVAAGPEEQGERTIELTCSNKTGMFKATEKARVEFSEDNSAVLVVALTGTSYHELFKGTFAAAVENGDNTENWIHGYQNTDGKWEFRIPLAEGENYIPCVSISNNYYEKYLNGQNPLERAFYARQFTIDYDAKTLEVDDYHETADFTVTSNVKDFAVEATAATTVVGGPNNNNYSLSPTLVMLDGTYDKVTYPTVTGGEKGNATADLTDGKFSISMSNAPAVSAFEDKKPIEMTFHVANDAPYKEAGTDVVRNVTIDLLAKTITIEGEELVPKVVLEDGTYALPGLAAGPSAMFNHFEDASKILIVEGDKATIGFITDGSTASVAKYSKIALAKSSEILTEQYQPTIAEGIPVVEGKRLLNDGTKGARYLFCVDLPKADVEAMFNDESDQDLFITVWNNVGSSTEKIPGWYKASDDIYLTLGSLGENTEIPATDIGEELKITNNTGMFKAVTANLEYIDDKTFGLIMALSGTGYQNLYKGTYEQAVLNGTATENWIAGGLNDAGKWEFRIPLAEGETYVPCVAISQSYYNKYLNGQNPLERAFYPRQFTIDYEAKTLVTDDYNETSDFTVTSGVKDFAVGETAATTVVGGPNSNNYSVSPIFVMEDEAYDKVTYPTVKGGTVGTATADLEDGKFAISMTNAPNKAAFKDKEPIAMSFHVSADAPYAEAGTDVTRNVTIDLLAKTISIEGAPLTVVPFEYNGTTVQFIKRNGDAFGMWTPQEGSTFELVGDKVELSIIPSNSKKTYSWMHWGGIDEELTKDVTFAEDGKIVLSVSKDLCGLAVPVAPIKTKDDTATTASQYYLAIPKEEYFSAPADYSEVEAQIARKPADLSIYTEESVTALNTAIDAVVEGKMKTEQDIVDKWANNIKKAIDGLVVKKIEHDKTEVQFIKADGSQFGMWKPLEGTTIDFDGDNVVIHYVQNKDTYKGFNWGNIVASKYFDEENAPTATINLNEDKSMDITVSKEECGKGLPIAVVKAAFGKGSWTSADQYYLAIPSEEWVEDADYSAVEAAVEKIPANILIYTDESVGVLETAFNAVVPGKKKPEQADVDKMASDLEAAIAGLVKKDIGISVKVDGEEVTDVTIDENGYDPTEAPYDGGEPVFLDKLPLYTYKLPYGTQKVEITLNNYVKEYSTYWYTRPTAEEKTAFVDYGFGKDETVDPKWTRIIAYADTAYDVDVNTQNLIRVQSGYNATFSNQSFNLYAIAFEELADYSGVDAAIASVPEDLSVYTDSSAKAVTDAVDAVVEGKLVSEQAEVDAMAKAINDAVAALAEKQAQDVKVTKTDGKVNYAVVAKGQKVLDLIEVSGNDGALSFKKVKGSKWITVDAKTGKITVDKYTPANLYKVVVKVRAAETGNYKAYSKNYQVKIQVTKAKQNITLKTVDSRTINFKTTDQTVKFVTSVSGNKGEVTYSRAKSNYITIDKKTGVVKVAKNTPAGTYKFTIYATAAAKGSYLQGQAKAVVTLKINPVSQAGFKVTKTDKTASYAILKNGSQVITKAITVKNAVGKVTYTKQSGSSAYLTINKNTGAITVKKGTRKGIFSIKVLVTAAGDNNHKKAAATVTVKVTV